jgi:hypothetical protein
MQNSYKKSVPKISSLGGIGGLAGAAPAQPMGTSLTVCFAGTVGLVWEAAACFAGCCGLDGPFCVHVQQTAKLSVEK